MKKENGITLIALVVTIIVLLILAGVSISLVVGNNGVLTQATNAVEKNREEQAREDVEMAWASATTKYWSDWATDSSKQKDEQFYQDELEGKETSNGRIEEITLSGSTYTVLYTDNDQGDLYTFEINADGKVEKKTGVILNKAALSLEPTETETLTAELVELEGTITWASDTPAVATVSNGVVTAVANGTAKITATCGSKSATCNVTVATKLVSISSLEGKYVNLNIGYVDQMDSTDYTTSTNIKKAWKVLSKDTTTGVVNLISTGHPLKFYHPSSDAAASVTEMNKISTETITVDASNSRGYIGNGFSTNNVKSLFSNTSVFTGIQPARYSTAGVSITSSTDAGIKTTGRHYWLGEANNADFLWYVFTDGHIGFTYYSIIGVRPVVSLVSNITITGGSGTDSAPYTLNGITY